MRFGVICEYVRKCICVLCNVCESVYVQAICYMCECSLYDQ